MIITGQKVKALKGLFSEYQTVETNTISFI